MIFSFQNHLLGLCAFVTVLPVAANEWPQWRGPHRDGISQETGLLKEWPKEGPKLIWKSTDVGAGYSTPAVVSERLYLLGNQGLDNEFVQALVAKDGKRIWSYTAGQSRQPQSKAEFPRHTVNPHGGRRSTLCSRF